MLNEKRWVLITGASGGIGQALVHRFVKDGYHVIATDIRINDDRESHAQVVKIDLDLELIITHSQAIDELQRKVDAITDGVGIACLINNAAVQILQSVESLTLNQWMTTWNVNLHAPFVLIKTFLSSLSKNKGSVLNMSSIHATQTKQKFVAYASSKAALSSLTRNLAVDVGKDIRFNAIEPAAVGTKMLLSGFDGDSQAFGKLADFHPSGRIASPDEIAELALFLCSDKCDFIQGACIEVTGGIHGCLSDPA